jgi:hypothetical protein
VATAAASENIGGLYRTRTCNHTVMSGRITAGFVDFLVCSLEIDCVAFRRGRLRNWCGPPMPALLMSGLSTTRTVPWVRIPLSPPFARFCAPNCDCARDCARDLHRRTYRYAKVSCRAKRPHGLNAISASGRTPNDVLLHWNAGKKDRAGICFAGVCARLCKLQLTGLPHDYRVRPAVMLWRTG